MPSISPSLTCLLVSVSVIQVLFFPCDSAFLSFCCYSYYLFVFLLTFCYNLLRCYCVTRSDQPGPSSTKLFSAPMKKRQKKSALRSSEKTTIINLYKLVEDTWPKDQFCYKKDLAKKTVETAGVGKPCYSL